MDQAQTERLLKCLESIAGSLMKLADPPMIAGWPPSPKVPEPPAYLPHKYPYSGPWKGTIVDTDNEAPTGEGKNQSPWLFRFLTGKT